MPAKLSTTVNKIKTFLNQQNARLVLEFHEFMKEDAASKRHQNNKSQVSASDNEDLESLESVDE